MSTLTPNYNLEKPEASDPFGDFRQLFNDNMDTIDANLGGGGGGGHTIVDADGNSLPQEDELQFTGAVSVTDDNVNGRTVVNVSGGSNLILDAQIYSDNEKVVGVWRDKKPLYQKTISVGTLPNNATTTTAHGISDIDAICSINGIAYDGSGKTLPLGYVNVDSYTYDVQVEVGKVNIEIKTKIDFSSYTGYITLLYTKTTDTAGSGGYEAYGFSPVIYSDVERVIGVWRDNKPLYQKTLYRHGTLSSHSLISFADVSALSIETLVFAHGVAREPNWGWCELPDSEVRVWYNENDGYIKLDTQSITFVDADSYITIQYTKTTDVAGSGDYNTYGVPTVHYSTSEQVIGTWVNSKPLYQKTVYYAGGVNGNITFAHGISDIDEIVSIEGIAKDTDVVGDFIPFARIRSDSLNIGISDVTLTSVIYYVPSQFGGRIVDIYVTIRYTKTSD